MAAFFLRGCWACLAAVRRMPAMVSETSAVSVGEGSPAARYRKRIAAARSLSVLPAWPRSRSAARKAATSRLVAGEGLTPCLWHKALHVRTAER